jgi:hypothetical protein
MLPVLLPIKILDDALQILAPIAIPFADVTQEAAPITIV